MESLTRDNVSVVSNDEPAFRDLGLLVGYESLLVCSRNKSLLLHEPLHMYRYERTSHRPESIEQQDGSTSLSAVGIGHKTMKQICFTFLTHISTCFRLILLPVLCAFSLVHLLVRSIGFRNCYVVIFSRRSAFEKSPASLYVSIYFFDQSETRQRISAAKRK